MRSLSLYVIIATLQDESRIYDKTDTGMIRVFGLSFWELEELMRRGGKPYVKVISGALQDRLKILAKAAGRQGAQLFSLEEMRMSWSWQQPDKPENTQN